jgi:hypothetical protein
LVVTVLLSAETEAVIGFFENWYPALYRSDFESEPCSLKIQEVPLNGPSFNPEEVRVK